jgi:hypothetical protein
MYLAFLEKDIGKEFKDKLEDGLQRLSRCWDYLSKSRNIAENPSLNSSDARA